MGKWTGKFVIGLTGNIGTGKSVVRKMLEHQGAYGIDADALSHRAIAKGAPGYTAIVETFGRWILAPDGEVDRARLGRIVFSDPDALKALEGIIHPLVDQAIDILIRRSTQRVIVIEAIKLIEAGISSRCNSIWTVYTPPEVQLQRLMQKRGMNEKEARQRIAAQPPQEKKMAAAQVVIKNVGSIADTYKQVSTAWEKVVPKGTSQPDMMMASVQRPDGTLNVLRGKPRHSGDIAGLMNRVSKNTKPRRADDIMMDFGEKAFLLLQAGTTLVGAVGWQVENLISRTTDVVIDPVIPISEALPILINEMEKASTDLQCEAALVFVTSELAQQEVLWRQLGYDKTSPNNLGIAAWQEAAEESMPPNTILYFKLLRTDRVLRPI